MKKNVFLLMLLAVVLVLGLAGCPPSDNPGDNPGDNSAFDYTPWVGTWKVCGLPIGDGNYQDIPVQDTMALTIYSNGTFQILGQVLGMDTEAYGRLDIDPDETTSFQIVPTSGVWHNVPPEEGGDANGNKVIDPSTLGGFTGYINRVLRSDGKWPMTGISYFNYLWGKQS